MKINEKINKRAWAALIERTGQKGSRKGFSCGVYPELRARVELNGGTNPPVFGKGAQYSGDTPPHFPKKWHNK
jgi:hypothetical protein